MANANLHDASPENRDYVESTVKVPQDSNFIIVRRIYPDGRVEYHHSKEYCSTKIDKEFIVEADLYDVMMDYYYDFNSISEMIHDTNVWGSFSRVIYAVTEEYRRKFEMLVKVLDADLGKIRIASFVNRPDNVDIPYRPIRAWFDASEEKLGGVKMANAKLHDASPENRDYVESTVKMPHDSDLIIIRRVYSDGRVEYYHSKEHCSIKIDKKLIVEEDLSDAMMNCCYDFTSFSEMIHDTNVWGSFSRAIYAVTEEYRRKFEMLVEVLEADLGEIKIASFFNRLGNNINIPYRPIRAWFDESEEKQGDKNYRPPTDAELEELLFGERLS